jgi:hypothetical protein
MLGELVLTGAKARGLLTCLNVAQGFWVPVVGLSWGFGFCLWVFVDFFFFFFSFCFGALFVYFMYA